MARDTANPKEVAALERLERRREKRWQTNLAAVMATPEGRGVMWALLARAGIFRSAFHSHGSVQSYNLGRQDFGHELMSELIKLGKDPYLAMEREGRDAEERDALEAQSHQQESSKRREE